MGILVSFFFVEVEVGDGFIEVVILINKECCESVDVGVVVVVIFWFVKEVIDCLFWLGVY